MKKINKNLLILNSRVSYNHHSNNKQNSKFVSRTLQQFVTQININNCLKQINLKCVLQEYHIFFFFFKTRNVSVEGDEGSLSSYTTQYSVRMLLNAEVFYHFINVI